MKSTLEKYGWISALYRTQMHIIHSYSFIDSSSVHISYNWIFPRWETKQAICSSNCFDDTANCTITICQSTFERNKNFIQWVICRWNKHFASLLWTHWRVFVFGYFLDTIDTKNASSTISVDESEEQPQKFKSKYFLEGTNWQKNVQEMLKMQGAMAILPHVIGWRVSSARLKTGMQSV